MASEELQHVVEEANTGRNFVLSAPFDSEMDGDARFGGVALDDGGAGSNLASRNPAFDERSSQRPYGARLHH
jgi:hypothetical protein